MIERRGARRFNVSIEPSEICHFLRNSISFFEVNCETRDSRLVASFPLPVYFILAYL